VYDAAVCIADRYKTKERFVEELHTTKHSDVVEFFYENAPRPINILAPYLSFANYPEELNLYHCAGILHALSKALDLRNLVTVEPQLRRTVNFSFTAEEDYTMQWAMLTKEWLDYEEILEFPKRVTLLSQVEPAPMQMAQPAYYPPPPAYYPPPMAYPPQSGYAAAQHNPYEAVAPEMMPAKVVEEQAEEVSTEVPETEVALDENGNVMITFTINEDENDDDFLADFFGSDDDDYSSSSESTPAPAKTEAPAEEAAEEAPESGPNLTGLAAMKAALGKKQ
jgi:hypothetical protein